MVGVVSGVARVSETVTIARLSPGLFLTDIWKYIRYFLFQGRSSSQASHFMKIARAIGTDITRTYSKLEKLTLLAKYVDFVTKGHIVQKVKITGFVVSIKCYACFSLLYLSACVP